MRTVEHLPGNQPSKTVSSLFDALPHLTRTDLGTVIWAGNGGCAALADHMAAELMTGFGDFTQSRRSISLCGNAVLLTAIVNDAGAESMFSAQIDTLVQEEDTVILLSTSGSSANIIRAALAAKAKHATVVSVVGRLPAKLSALSDAAISIKAGTTQQIQDEMSPLLHALCSKVVGAGEL